MGCFYFVVVALTAKHPKQLKPLVIPRYSAACYHHPEPLNGTHTYPKC